MENLNLKQRIENHQIVVLLQVGEEGNPSRQIENIKKNLLLVTTVLNQARKAPVWGWQWWLPPNFFQKISESKW